MVSSTSETLAQRIERGGLLSGKEATRLSRALLSDLEAAHGRGTAHGAISSQSIVIQQGRPSLTGFQTAPAGAAAGDLFALASVIYESTTGRRWISGTKPSSADWSGIPRRLRYAMRKALATNPSDRFSDAAAFQRALWVPRPGPLVWPAVVVLAFAAVLIGTIVLCKPLGLCPERSYELMVLPFSVEGDSTMGPRVGVELAALVAHKLQDFHGFAVVPGSVALKIWEDSVGGRTPHRLRVASRAGGSVVGRKDALLLRVEVRDSLGRPLHSVAIAGRQGAETELADSVVLQLVRWFHPELLPPNRARRIAQIRWITVLARSTEV